MRKPRNIPAAVLKTWQVFRPPPDCFVELTLVLLAIKNEIIIETNLGSKHTTTIFNM